MVLRQEFFTKGQDNNFASPNPDKFQTNITTFIIRSSSNSSDEIFIKDCIGIRYYKFLFSS